MKQTTALEHALAALDNLSADGDKDAYEALEVLSDLQMSILKKRVRAREAVWRQLRVQRVAAQGD